MRRATEDVVIGAGAISTPLWLEPASSWLQFLGLLFGLVLIIVRIYKTLKESQDGPS